jgi:hypothetical protein
MKYYIYSHTRLDTNKIFYIGLGKTYDINKPTRAHIKSCRSKEWKDVYNDCNGQYIVQILHVYDNEIDCCIKEIELIDKYGRKHLNQGDLVNKAPGGHKWKDNQKIYQYDLNGNFIAEWISAKAAASTLNLIYTNIYACCLRKGRVGEYQFRTYKKLSIDVYVNKKYKTIFLFNVYGKFISEFSSGIEAAKYLNAKPIEITQALRTKGSVRNHYVSHNRNKCYVKRLIFQFDKNNNHIATYSSLPDVVKKLNLNSHNSIDNALKGKVQKSAYGYTWREIKNTEIDVE